MSKPMEKQLYTYEDYLKWDEDNRYELIEGTPYLLSSPSSEHQLKRFFSLYKTLI